MKVLVLGGKGMAGHVISSYLQELNLYEIWFTSRSSDSEGFIQLDVRDVHQLEEVISEIMPEFVINAAGLLNDQAANHMYDAMWVNSWLPHHLTYLSTRYAFKLIHISTDCVFSGERGDYRESDLPDGSSVYAMTKKLGEVTSAPHITIRTSIVGPELKSNGIGLLHWFLKEMEKGSTIQGYTDVFWNGVTTLELAKCIDWCIHQPVSGLVHLCGERKLSKYELLTLFQSHFDYRNQLQIGKDGDPKSDKSLICERTDFAFKASPYPQMIEELKEWMVNHSYFYSYPFLNANTS